MHRILAVGFVLAVLSGCAQQPQRPRIQIIKPPPCPQCQLSDKEIATIICRARRESYYTLLNRRCACPDDVAHDGTLCGKRASRRACCDIEQVSKEDIKRYRRLLAN